MQVLMVCMDENARMVEYLWHSTQSVYHIQHSMVWAGKTSISSKNMGYDPRMRNTVTMVREEQNKVRRGISKHPQLYSHIKDKNKNMGKRNAENPGSFTQ